MKELAAVALVVGAIVSYFFVATVFAWYQPLPVAHLMLAAAGCYLAARTFRERHGWRRSSSVLAVTLTAGLTGLFGWYVFDYSAYSDTEADVELGENVGDELASLILDSSEGVATPVFAPGLSRGTLFVLYRGYW